MPMDDLHTYVRRMLVPHRLGKSQLTIAPSENVLIGMDAILGYIGLKSPTTFRRWVEEHGFPAFKTPRRPYSWMTTCTAADRWLFAMATVQNNRRAKRMVDPNHYMKGYNNRASEALKDYERPGFDIIRRDQA